jgi:hypothetical protein
MLGFGNMYKVEKAEKHTVFLFFKCLANIFSRKIIKDSCFLPCTMYSRIVNNDPAIIFNNILCINHIYLNVGAHSCWHLPHGSNRPRAHSRSVHTPVRQYTIAGQLLPQLGNIL